MPRWQGVRRRVQEWSADDDFLQDAIRLRSFEVRYIGGRVDKLRKVYQRLSKRYERRADSGRIIAKILGGVLESVTFVISFLVVGALILFTGGAVDTWVSIDSEDIRTEGKS